MSYSTNALHKLKQSCLLLLLMPCTAFAIGELPFYVGGSLTSSFAKISNDNIIIQYSTITDNYPATTGSATSLMMSGNAGYEFSNEDNTIALALGVGVYTGMAYKFYGNLIETPVGGPSSSLYTYHFNVSSTRVMAETQLTFILGSLAPFVNAGIGPVWNSTSQYTESPNDDIGYPPLPPFNSKTRNSVAYQIGLGVSYIFSSEPDTPDNQRISLGYRYVNLGQSSLGERPNNYPYSLDFGAYRAQEIYVGYTHNF